MTIMGVSSSANVTMDWCLVTRDINVAFGAHGYGAPSPTLIRDTSHVAILTLSDAVSKQPAVQQR